MGIALPGEPVIKVSKVKKGKVKGGLFVVPKKKMRPLNKTG